MSLDYNKKILLLLKICEKTLLVKKSIYGTIFCQSMKSGSNGKRQ